MSFQVQYPHRIRLRGPWECEPLPLAEAGPTTRRIVLPCRWADVAPSGFAGKVRFRRRFGRPTNLDEGERVWLTCSPAAGLDITLNGIRSRLVDELDVTADLEPRNELIVESDAADTSWLEGEIALEIRRTAYLKDVVASIRDGSLIVEGTVVGFADRPLDLYAIADRSTAAYSLVEPSATGRRFTLDCGRTSAAILLRVDLVDAATVWYTLERVVDPAAHDSEEGSTWRFSR